MRVFEVCDVRSGRSFSRWGLSLLLLGGLAGCPAADDDEGPTSEVTPTLMPGEVTAAVISATEVDVLVRLETAGETVIEYGVGDYALSRTGTDELSQTFYLYGLTPDTAYQYRVKVAGIELRAGTFTTLAAPSGPFRVCFDNSHAQQGGNADWVIDDNAPTPSPTKPSKATDWKGAYSSFGFDLWKTGHYTVTTQKKDLTFGDYSGDLADQEVLVVPEPNSPFDDDEILALQRFMEAGGGVLLIANHEGSDRNGDGYDAPDVWEEVLNALDPSPGFRIDHVGMSEDPATNFRKDDQDPVLHGPQGAVATMDFHGTTTFQEIPGSNPSFRGLLWKSSSTSQGTNGLLALRIRYGAGRMVAVGDSAPADDGTGNSSDELYDSWDLYDNRAFFMNAVAWLAGAVD